MLKKDYFRKNLLRVKQLADQGLGRAYKTAVLTDDLLTCEKRVEIFKQVCQATVKKVSACMQGEGKDLDKRLKKIPESQLSTSMAESATALGEDTLMGSIFAMCGEGEGKISQSLMDYEMNVEQEVIAPLQSLLENEIPSITKTRKQLAKLTLDMDSASNRWQTAVRQSHATGTNMAHAAAKAETIKDEMEEASQRVEQCRDALATEMFTFVSREAEYCQRLLNLVESQAQYHRNAMESLERLIPELQGQIDQHPLKPVYGYPLHEHLHVTEREIASVIEDCVCTLLEIGMEEEGLFRVAGGAAKVKKLKAAFDAGIIDMSDYVRDVHCIAGALKLYLRELPEPLLTYELYEDWMAAAQIQDPDQRLQALWMMTSKLPKPNYDNLKYLIKFLAKLAESSDVNKMTPSNIAIVIGPNLIWPNNDTGPSVITASTQTSITESFVTHAEWFFPGEIDFNISGSGSDSSSTHNQGLPYNVVPPSSPKMERDSNVAASSPPLNHSPGTGHLAPSQIDATSSSPSLEISPSPKISRRATKKPAPAPPPDKTHKRQPSDSKPQGQQVEQAPPSQSPPITVHQESPLIHVSSPETSPHQTGSLERPKMAPPDRPSGKPPERPERPHAPSEKKQGVSEKVSGTLTEPQGAQGDSVDAGHFNQPPPSPPDRPKAPPPDRPHLPPPERPHPPAKQGSVKPARPQPPPPPPPVKGRQNSESDSTKL